jgi:hypothetical protein
MDRIITAWPFATALLVGMLMCLEVGRRLGKHSLANDPQGALSGIGVAQGAMFTLYGLLLAFTFSEATSRYNARIQLIQEEANAIGTAYLRLDLLAAEAQPALREQLRKYVDSRLEVYRKAPDIAAVKAELSESAKLQTGIWTQTVAVSRLPGGHPDAAKMLLPAVNAMFDIAATRTMAARIHPPPIIFRLLFVLALLCSVLIGYGLAGSKQRNWLHSIAFAVVTAISVYVILDLDYPRAGLIRVDAYDQVLVDVRESMR